MISSLFYNIVMKLTVLPVMHRLGRLHSIHRSVLLNNKTINVLYMYKIDKN